MNRAANSSPSDVNLVFFLVDGTHWTEDDEMVLISWRRLILPVVLCINRQITFKTVLTWCSTWWKSLRRWISLMLCQSRRSKVRTLMYCKARVNISPKAMAYFPRRVRDGSLPQRFMASERSAKRCATGMNYLYSVIRLKSNVSTLNPDNDGFHINALILKERTGRKKWWTGKAVGKDHQTDWSSKHVSTWKSYSVVRLPRDLLRLNLVGLMMNALRSLGYIDDL